ncbi:hypothetical protein, partial [Streptomyces sp. WAC02707]|uniref:hypothetical protein n=1 Tax=Streptomyces sp. WAC02707 TaxID=2487417 RepID=UPI001C8E494C
FLPGHLLRFAAPQQAGRPLTARPQASVAIACTSAPPADAASAVSASTSIAVPLRPPDPNWP